MPTIPFGSLRTMYWLGSNISIPAPSSINPEASDTASFYIGGAFFVPTIEYISSAPVPSDPPELGLLYTLTPSGSYNAIELDEAPIAFSESPGNWGLTDTNGSTLTQGGFAWGSYLLGDFFWGGVAGSFGATGAPVTEEIPSISGTNAAPPDYDYIGMYATPYTLDTANPGYVVFDNTGEEFFMVDLVTLTLSPIEIAVQPPNPPFIGAQINDGTIYTTILGDLGGGPFGGIMQDGVLFTYDFETGPIGEISSDILGGTFILAKDGEYFYASWEIQNGDDLWEFYIVEIQRDGDVYNLIKVEGGSSQARAYLDGFAAGTNSLTVTGNTNDGKFYLIGGEF